MDTTGAIVICKNDMAHQSLADQLKEHSITRKYRALVHGNLKEDEGTVEGPIGRHATDRKRMAINYKNGKPAVTHYKVLVHTLLLSASWRPGALIRFACIWQASVIHLWEILPMGRRSVRSNTCKGSAFMPWF